MTPVRQCVVVRRQCVNALVRQCVAVRYSIQRTAGQSSASVRQCVYRVTHCTRTLTSPTHRLQKRSTRHREAVSASGRHPLLGCPLPAPRRTLAHEPHLS